MISQNMRSIIADNQGCERGFLRNLLKEYLQSLALNYIYNSLYGHLIFTGGSVLRVCFGLPRLSEDLDFDYERQFDPNNFFQGITDYFKKTQKIPAISVKMNSKRLYLKFPILKQLGIASASESDQLYLKIELYPLAEYSYKVENQAIFRDGFSFLVRRYSLEDLMAGKINALLARVWFKGKRNEVKIKGRDFFDLYWFMQQKITPNYKRIFYQQKNMDAKDIWQLLQERVAHINPRDLEYDLLPLIKDPIFVINFSKSYQELFQKELGFYSGTVKTQ